MTILAVLPPPRPLSLLPVQGNLQVGAICGKEKVEKRCSNHDCKTNAGGRNLRVANVFENNHVRSTMLEKCHRCLSHRITTCDMLRAACCIRQHLSHSKLCDGCIIVCDKEKVYHCRLCRGKIGTQRDAAFAARRWRAATRPRGLVGLRLRRLSHAITEAGGPPDRGGCAVRSRSSGEDWPARAGRPRLGRARRRRQRAA